MTETIDGRDPSRRPPMSLPNLTCLTSTNIERADVLYGRASKLRVFISSEMRSGALRAERLVAASAVDTHPDAEPWLWERNANAGRYSSYDICVGSAMTSDILLLILSDELTHVTEAEWRAAKSAGANCAMLLKTVPTRTPKAQAFIQAERNDCIDVSYTDIDQLKRAVGDALTQCMTDAVRQRSLARRWRASGQGPARPQLLEAGIERAETLYERGLVQDSSAVLAEIDLLLGGRIQRPEHLELITGLVQGATGQVATAMAAYQRVISNPGSTDHAVAVAYQNLGIEAMRAGHLKLAARYLKAAYRRHRALENWFGVLQVALNMGNLSLESGDTAGASSLANVAEELRKAFAQALPQQHASEIGLRASVSAQLGRYEEALAGYKAAYSIGRRCKDLQSEMVSCQNVSAAYFDLGRTALARRWAAKALELIGDQGATWRREEIHRLLAIVACGSDLMAEARHHFEEARALAADMGDEWRVATVTAEIAAVLVAQNSDDASAELDRARDLLTALDETEWLTRVGLNRAALAIRGGNTDEAVSILEEVAGLTGVKRDSRSHVHERLADTHLLAKRPTDATRHFRKALSLQSPTAETALNAGIYAHRLQENGYHRNALGLYNVSLRRSVASNDAAVIYDVRSD